MGVSSAVDRARWARLIVVLVVILATAACGGDDSDGGAVDEDDGSESTDPSEVDPPDTDEDETGDAPTLDELGTYDTSYGTMTLEIDGATVTGEYNWTDGALVAGELHGLVFTGHWAEPSGSPTCDEERFGTEDWGRLEFTFEPDGSSFTGVWNDCDAEPSSSWDGTRVGGATDDTESDDDGDAAPRFDEVTAALTASGLCDDVGEFGLADGSIAARSCTVAGDETLRTIVQDFGNDVAARAHGCSGPDAVGTHVAATVAVAIYDRDSGEFDEASFATAVEAIPSLELVDQADCSDIEAEATAEQGIAVDKTLQLLADHGLCTPSGDRIEPGSGEPVLELCDGDPIYGVFGLPAPSDAVSLLNFLTSECSGGEAKLVHRGYAVVFVVDPAAVAAGSIDYQTTPDNLPALENVADLMDGVTLGFPC